MIKPQLISNTLWKRLKKLQLISKSFRRTFRKKRSITLFAIAVVDGRLKVIEGLPQ